MLLPPRTTLWIVVLVALAGTASRADDSLSVWEYLARQASQQGALLPAVPQTQAAWEQDRAELLQDLAAALGLPPREPMKAAIRDRHEDDDLVFEEIAYLWGETAYVSATAIRKASIDGRHAAVIVPPGLLGHHQFLPYREFVRQLAGHGYLVLFIDDPRSGARQAPAAGLYAAASAAGIPLAGIQVFDVLRGLDYLLTRADVDPARIGVAGLGEGAVQAFLAAALEPRLAFVAAAAGTSTYEALVHAAAGGAGPRDPSAFAPDLLARADLDRIAACLAPRPVLIAGTPSGPWQAAGHRQVLTTMKTVYGHYDAQDRIRQLSGEDSDTLAPYVPEILRWLEQVAAPSGSAASPESCGVPEEPDFSMLAYLQRRSAAQAASRPVPDSPGDWQAEREAVVHWLRQRCAIDRLQPGTDRSEPASEANGMVIQRLALSVDADFYCPAVLFRPADTGSARVGVVLSHDDRASAAEARLRDAAARLVAAGYWVLVPDHASVDMQSRQPLVRGERPGFYGDDAAAFYGPADAVGLPPLALRVAENLAAFRHLAARPELDPDRILIAGIGLGGVDACLAALLEDRIAGVASLNATTLRDWVLTVAPDELRFFHLAPVLPSMLDITDLDRLYAALAPRPLLLARLREGWPRSGFEQVVETASAIYHLQQADDALLVPGARDLAALRDDQLPEGLARHLAAVARTLIPAPPQPGIVGSVEGIKARSSVDSAAGLIWLVAEMDGYEQTLGGGGDRLQTWSFFNGRGAAQSGRAITPLLFRQEGDAYELTGIGTTRINAGSGVQTFDFEPVAGTADVGDDHYFGWHTGDTQGSWNPGVVEYQDAPDARMLILTADGQMNQQTPTLGAAYRLQSQFPRRYSVMAKTHTTEEMR